VICSYLAERGRPPVSPTSEQVGIPISRIRSGTRGDVPISLASLEIRAAGDGAPEAFYNGKPAAVSISISHSRDRSFCAAGPLGMGIGCDLEWVEPREENFAADYFTPEEISFVMQAPVKRELAETLIWSAKETTLKILRKGLSQDTRSVLIRPDLSGPDDAWRSWTGRCLESERIFNGWWRAADGFIHTIASYYTERPK
jgi:4'-phosphopantetheinyl transferase